MIPHLDSSSVYHANTLPSIRTHFKDQQTRFQTCPNIKFQHQLHIVPMIEQLNPDKDRVIQQGLVLCTRTEQWYTRKKTTTRELQLRKTRLRWRRFKAVLKLDRLELYHKLIINTQRLAHIIYLDNQPPHRRVKLAMISTQDAVWSLEFMDRDTKCLIAYHFQSSHLSDAQAWYMSIYNLLPSTHYCKKPIPSYVDIHVLLEPNLLKEPLRIRLPLDYLTSLYEHFDIRTRDMKPILLSLLEKNEALSHINWKRKKLKLCWKHQTLNHSTEWVKEETSLISPSLIEKSHSLELHVLDQEEQDTKKSTTFDGLLIQKIYTNKKGKCKNVYYYSVLYGHHLFFFDGLYYFQCKKHDEKKKKDAKKQHWFSATTGFLFQQRKLTISKQSNHPNKRTQYKLGSVESSPHLKLSKPELIPPPDPSRLLNAKHVIDLHRVEYVEPCHQDKIFMLHINGTSLYYEAPNTQIMLEWVTLINNAFTLDRLLLYFNRDQHRQILVCIFMFRSYC
ncbi:uncharacterized protein B0P05DRAFT_476440 [Gilbertella persicaria]|uniref:uncharacterized protein n=1 Tax=Gilbertella persicaria TaxID=101096 RepID=UPI00222095FC|nr:uncharacterized protein B0P05DRAFT_476440 [Gilbertella persicaria]KAI8064272.1 hypothetical protein B0P05DRAFT_476440 [Gilbertella persicaria]